MPAEPKGRRRGLRIGKYELSTPIHLWGASGVYRALDTEKEREVFLKLLTAEIAGNAAVREWHQREAAKARELKSPHAVGILEFGEASGTWYLVVEALEFLGLDEYRSKQGAPYAEQVQRLLAQAVSALQQAQKKGALPSEVTPTSFVIVPRKQGPELRWIPLSLLRAARSDPGIREADFRAPELRQRESKGADPRALIFSLGAVIVHFITGTWIPTSREPTAGLAGADWKELRDVLRRMLAPRPEDRFASFDEIADALGLSSAEPEAVPEEELQPDRPQDESAGTGEEDEGSLAALRDLAAAESQDVGDRVRIDLEENDVKPKRRPAEPEDQDAPAPQPPARGKAMARRRMDDDDDADERDRKPEAEPPPRLKKKVGAAIPPWILIAGGAGVLVLAVLIGWLTTREPRPPIDKQAKGGDKTRIEQPVQPKEEKPENKKEEKKPKGLPLLYTPSKPLDLAKLTQEIYGPWAGAAPLPQDAVVYKVMRAPPIGKVDKGTKYFDSIAAACAAAEKGKATIIEIQDNGPFFEPALALADKHVRIQGSATYRPLLIWDTAQLSKKDLDPKVPPAFISMTNGDLLLGNLDVVVDWPGKDGPPVALARVTQGDLLAWDTVFSITGDFQAPAAAIRFESKDGDKFKCRLNKCVVRGSATAVDLKAPTGEAFFDGCLFVGSEPPLVRVQAGTAQAHPTVRVLRSSLIAGNVILEATASANAAAKPALHWIGWDVFIARDRKEPGGTLFQLPAEAVADDCRWKATNCVYVNFQTLLDAKSPIAASDHGTWNKTWQQTEGDKVIADPLSVLEGTDPAEVHPLHFRPSTQSPLAFAATSSPGVLGADFDMLPYVRPHWKALGTQQIAVPVVEVLKSNTPPQIPKGTDGKYYGGRVELGFGKNELTSFLKEMHKKPGLGANVVLHLAGTGVQKFSPLYLHNFSLTLYFEPPKKGEAPLVLLGDPIEFGPKWQRAFMHVDGGNLNIIGGEIRAPEPKADSQIKYLIEVDRGNLRVHGATLRGPLAPPKDSYWGLIRFEGSRSENWNAVYGMTLHESTLVAAPLLIHFAYPGIRARLEQNLLVAAGDGIHIDVGASPTARANIQCTLENNTIAVRQAAVRVGEIPKILLNDPILVQSKLNAWQSPFEERATVVMYDGAGLTRGYLNWQGETDAFDQRFAGYAVASENGKMPKLETPQTFTTWQRMFGPLGSVKAHKNVPFKGTLTQESLEKLQLDVLATPAGLKLDPLPGANLDRLGITGKKPAPVKK